MRADNKCYCKRCGEPVTWFNYKNIWEGGKIVARQHTNCEASDILRYKAEHRPIDLVV